MSITSEREASMNFPEEVVAADEFCRTNGVYRGNVHPVGYVVCMQNKNLVSGLLYEFPFGKACRDGGLDIEGNHKMEISFPTPVSRDDAKKIIADIREQKNYYDCGLYNVFGARNARRRAKR